MFLLLLLLLLLLDSSLPLAARPAPPLFGIQRCCCLTKFEHGLINRWVREATYVAVDIAGALSYKVAEATRLETARRRTPIAILKSRTNRLTPSTFVRSRIRARFAPCHDRRLGVKSNHDRFVTPGSYSKDIALTFPAVITTFSEGEAAPNLHLPRCYAVPRISLA